MTVGELKRILADLPDDMPVVCDRFSDVMDQEPPEVREVLHPSLDRHGHAWYTRYYPNQHAEKPETLKVLHFEGN